ncbi:DNA polymerase III PolC [Striga asiatica]|uniref:DNA polymerase III PolC n=1 Tax=Striga asiatica TaxID=4170 RepID=A0A5A7PRV9_STRAF|nr:DNA polymerase III PolC [Striga asiatica]
MAQDHTPLLSAISRIHLVHLVLLHVGCNNRVFVVGTNRSSYHRSRLKPAVRRPPPLTMEITKEKKKSQSEEWSANSSPGAKYASAMAFPLSSTSAGTAMAIRIICYLFNESIVVTTFSFIGSTVAPESFLDARKSRESSSSKALQILHPSQKLHNKRNNTLDTDQPRQKQIFRFQHQRHIVLPAL